MHFFNGYNNDHSPSHPLHYFTDQCYEEKFSSSSQEGNLAVGDQLLQINDESVVNLKSDEVATKLHMLERVGQAIRLVVARGDQGREGPEGASPEGTDVSIGVFYVYNGTSFNDITGTKRGVLIREVSFFRG